MSDNYKAAVTDDVEYDGAREMILAEKKYITTQGGPEPQYGLALSGGGIRSASYCLGVLQALAKTGLLTRFDYLSTVSGGGYIGASLSYLWYQSAESQKKKRPGKTGLLKRFFEYLSKVSGGGNIGALLSHLLCRPKESRKGQPPVNFDASADNFPYRSNLDLPDASEGGPRREGGLLRHLRQNAKYLRPGRNITLLSLTGVLVRNGLVSLTVHLALLVLVLQLVYLAYNNTLHPNDIRSSWPLIVSAGAFGLFGAMSVLYVLASSLFEHVPDSVSYLLRRTADILTHLLFLVGLFGLTIGALPYADYWLRNIPDPAHLPSWLAWAVPENAKNAPPLVGAMAAILGVLGNVRGYLQIRSGNGPKIPTTTLVALASTALLFGVLLILFDLIASNAASPGDIFGFSMTPGMVLAIFAALFLVFGALPNINYLSIHRYYRDRLMETFMPDPALFSSCDPEERTGRSNAGNETLLGKIFMAPKKADQPDTRNTETLAQPDRKKGLPPYHIINANIVLVSSNYPRYRGRGGDNFILSPRFTGSRATGWELTDSDQKTGVSLATAMAISGAAISPNTGVGGEGVTRQPILSVLMSLFNVRMGYWLANPRMRDSRAKRPWARLHPNLIFPGLWESFGRENLDEHGHYVLLTDGGHFENLGLYELVRRRLKLILVCDGTADPNYTFSDLANAIEKVRADFGACIDIKSLDLRALVPVEDRSGTEKRAAMSIAKRGYIIAPIRYARPEQTGVLIYLNTTFFRNLPADLYGYRREHPNFPDQPTSHQFFDEKEFEAYRELGFQTAYRLSRDLRDKAIAGEFSAPGFQEIPTFLKT